MKKIVIYMLLFSWIFSQFNLEPRMLGMSGAYTTVASGYQSMGVNPANLATNKSLSINLFSGNLFLVNDFMSVNLYNDLNGADFNNTASASYYPKNEILDQIKGSEIEIEGGAVIPIPILNFAYKNFAISSINRSYTKFNIPKTVIDIMLNGNTKDERFMLGLGGELISCNEIGFTYAHKFDLGFPVHVGMTFKYLQGLAYLKMQDVEDNGSYILTEQTAFHGSGKYLVEQAFGGTGTATDFGIVLPDFINGWNVGLSLINIGGNIEWTSNNPTRELLGSTFEDISIMNFAGWVGWIIDIGTGSVFKYSRKAYDMDLEPIAYNIDELQKDTLGRLIVPDDEGSLFVYDEEVGYKILFD